MQPIRYNIFNQIHKGLRALLYHTALQLQQADFTREGDVREAVERVREVIYLFEGHAHTEDTLAFPMVSEAAPELVAELEAQHAEDHRLGEELEAAVATLHSAGSPLEAIHAGNALQQAFQAFTAFNLNHMNLEETAINAALWETYTDAELHGLTMQIVATIPPEKNARYSYWMLKGLSMTEIGMWYKGMQAGAPDFVFNSMLELAQSALAPQQYGALTELLRPEVATA
jgi:hypothetical protein